MVFILLFIINLSTSQTFAVIIIDSQLLQCFQAFCSLRMYARFKKNHNEDVEANFVNICPIKNIMVLLKAISDHFVVVSLN